MTPLQRIEAAILKLEHVQILHEFALLLPILGLLDDAARRMRVEQNQDGIPIHYRYQLALADAILGDTQ